MFNNRVLLNWKEPRYGLNYINEQVSWKIQILYFGKLVGKFALGGLAVGIIIVLIAMVRHGYDKVEVVSSILFFVAAGCVLGLVFASTTILNMSVSPEIFLREKDILIISVSDGANISYKDIQSCNLVEKKLEESEIYVLEIKHWDGNESFIEIAPHISNNDLIEILQSRDVQIKLLLINPIKIV